MHRNERNDPRRAQDRDRQRHDRDDLGGRERERQYDDNAWSGGWSRDGYGFRGPSFRDAPRDERELRARRDDGWHAPGARHPDHYDASGGYFDDQRSRREQRREPDTRASGRGKGPKNFTRSDERILEDVCHALEDCDVDASQIEVRVTNGEVTLEGHVADRRDKREAEDVCADTRGVKQVHNLLRIGDASSTSTAAQSGNGTRASSSRS